MPPSTKKEVKAEIAMVPYEDYRGCVEMWNVGESRLKVS